MIDNKPNIRELKPCVPSLYYIKFAFYIIDCSGNGFRRSSLAVQLFTFFRWRHGKKLRARNFRQMRKKAYKMVRFCPIRFGLRRAGIAISRFTRGLLRCHADYMPCGAWYRARRGLPRAQASHALSRSAPPRPRGCAPSSRSPEGKRGERRRGGKFGG